MLNEGLCLASDTARAAGRRRRQARAYRILFSPLVPSRSFLPLEVRDMLTSEGGG